MTRTREELWPTNIRSAGGYSGGVVPIFVFVRDIANL
jgi:hypothetical protein